MKDGSQAHASTHGHGLAEDLAAIDRLCRRRALAWLGSAAGSSLLLGSAGSVAQSVVDAAVDTATVCTADPQETAGPYPADGTNTSRGPTSDILTADGIVRRDIRPSLLGSSTVAEGVPLRLRLTLADSGSNCAALAGRAIYLWHCDRAGDYSLYTAPEESYLRGVQVTDAQGQVTFTTIFPACYSGRWPHIHFEVFESLETATNGRNALLTSQLALPKSICSTVYANAAGYERSRTNLQQVSLRTDNVFGDNTRAQLVAMTPAMKGSVDLGYKAAATIGLAV